MMKPNHKALIQRILNRCGYRIERFRPNSKDPYLDQRTLAESRQIQVATVFDLGAHIGSASKRYREIFPTARIHAFEPYPASFAQLQKLATQDALLTVLGSSRVDLQACKLEYSIVSPK